MNRFFRKDSTYINRARNLAMLWTLLIFILCFLPGHDLPNVPVPFIDKWAHVTLFGVFTFLWHCTIPTANAKHKIVLLVIAVFIGWLVEYVQGHYIPDRSQDNMDTLADSVGGFIGILIYTAAYYTANYKAGKSSA